eukprot:4123084-Pyramimonas_sp.AAC.1
MTRKQNKCETTRRNNAAGISSSSLRSAHRKARLRASRRFRIHCAFERVLVHTLYNSLIGRCPST